MITKSKINNALFIIFVLVVARGILLLLVCFTQNKTCRILYLNPVDQLNGLLSLATLGILILYLADKIVDKASEWYQKIPEQ